jgi:hypothetical protein
MIGGPHSSRERSANDARDSAATRAMSSLIESKPNASSASSRESTSTGTFHGMAPFRCSSGVQMDRASSSTRRKGHAASTEEGQPHARSSSVGAAPKTIALGRKSWSGTKQERRRSLFVHLTNQDHETVSIPWNRITMVKGCERGSLVYLDDGTNIHVREDREDVTVKIAKVLYHDQGA